VAATIAGLVAVLALVAVPFLTKDRVLPAVVPQPPALERVALVRVRPGGRACLNGIVVDPYSQIAQIKVGTRGAPGLPITLALDGAGYHAVGHAAGGYADNSTLAIPVRAPRRATEVNACVRNDGPHIALLYGANDRATAAATTTVDGRPITTNYDLAFHEARPTSFAHRASAIAARVTRFRPGGPWLAWLLAGLVLAGVPVALVAAVASSAEE
jgi:hypothetical protein